MTIIIISINIFEANCYLQVKSIKRTKKTYLQFISIKNNNNNKYIYIAPIHSCSRRFTKMLKLKEKHNCLKMNYTHNLKCTLNVIKDK